MSSTYYCGRIVIGIFSVNVSDDYPIRYRSHVISICDIETKKPEGK